MAAGVTIKMKRKAGAFSNGELAAGEFGFDTSNSNIYVSFNGTTVVNLTAIYQPLDSDLTAFAAKTAPSGAVVGTTDAQTLSGKIISLNSALGSDDTYEGTVIAGRNAGATIAQWEAVYLGGSSTWLLADANGSGTYPARGLAVAAYSNTNPALILTQGVVRNDAWNWTVNGDIFLSTTAGGLTQTAPSGSGDKIQAVGWAITADIAYFHFNQTYLTKS